MKLIWEEFGVVALGGAIGALLRFVLSMWVQGLSRHKDFPWGIFVVNLLGCLLIGIVAGLLVKHLSISPLWRAGIVIGVLGGFTTFSSFSLDTITLLQSGDYLSAGMYVALSVIFGIMATAVGLTFANLFLP